MTAPSIETIIALMSFDNTTHNVGYSSTGAIKAQATHVTSPAPPYSPSAATPNCLKLDANTGAGAFDSRAIIGHTAVSDPTTGNCFRMVFPFRYDSSVGTPSSPGLWIMRFRNSAITYSVTDFELGLKMNTSGQIELHTSPTLANGTLALVTTGPTVLSTDTWYFLEVGVVRRPTGAVHNYQLIVRINGAVEINYSLLGSAYGSGDRGWGGVVFGDAGAAGLSCIHYIGPYYAGYENPSVDMLKPTIRRMRPDGDVGAGYNLWHVAVSSGSATATFADWDDAVPDDGTTQAVTAHTGLGGDNAGGAGKKQASDTAALADTTYTPYGLTVNGWVFYSGGSKSISGQFIMVTDGSTDVEVSPTVTITAGYHTLSDIQQLVFLNKPGGTGWDDTALDALRIGYRGVCVAGPTNGPDSIQVSMIYAEVLINANEANWPQLPLPPKPPNVEVTQAVKRGSFW